MTFFYLQKEKRNGVKINDLIGPGSEVDTSMESASDVVRDDEPVERDPQRPRGEVDVWTAAFQQLIKGKVNLNREVSRCNRSSEI